MQEICRLINSSFIHLLVVNFLFSSMYSVTQREFMFFIFFPEMRKNILSERALTKTMLSKNQLYTKDVFNIPFYIKYLIYIYTHLHTGTCAYILPPVHMCIHYRHRDANTKIVVLKTKNLPWDTG